jgi:hypothetical protein
MQQIFAQGHKFGYRITVNHSPNSETLTTVYNELLNEHKNLLNFQAVAAFQMSQSGMTPPRIPLPAALQLLCADWPHWLFPVQFTQAVGYIV